MHLDLAGDDVGLDALDLGFHFRGDQLGVVLVQRPVNPAFGQTQGLDARLPAALGGVIPALVRGQTHGLDHGGQHGARLQVVLVGIHTDGQLAFVLGSLIDTDPGATGGGIDHIGALGELGLGQFCTLGRVGEGCRGGAGHVLIDVDLRIDVLGALLIAALELADQRDVHAAHEADLAGLGGDGCQGTHQEGTFMLLEDEGLDVRLVDHHVDDGELGVRELGGDFLYCGTHVEADGDDGAVATAGQTTQALLALGFVLGFELLDLDAFVLVVDFDAVAEHGFVEGLVEFACGVIDDGGLGGCLGGQGSEGEGGHGGQLEHFSHDRILDCYVRVHNLSWQVIKHAG